MFVNWSFEAAENLEKTIQYWDNRTQSTEYSDKILDAIEELEAEISENPYFLAKFRKKVKLYQKIFFKGKFSIFYDIIEEENTITIKHFKSNRQKTIY
ncbi:type II toxin-antitoxin system RelE/ParE family toxin [Capnocytophaga canis]|uniref:type II toxin-antitoxin system RelE/ParE family toxin n=1 Tax=Capnocytophaga canis TaxID=1848903 RepID=UPI0015625D9D|nr:type II toxin-antitoxin system RelE/ParE family toxin [Capnocytophaga canis]